uniref:Uncharacterized protein n=1 Tax=viral metagenome TaxID=1070528 RepID=A0A6C0KTQ8_9ZZZZ
MRLYKEYFEAAEGEPEGEPEGDNGDNGDTTADNTQQDIEDAENEEGDPDNTGGGGGTTSAETPGGGVDADGKSKLNPTEKAGLDQVAKDAKTKAPITDKTAEDASKENPTTEDGKNVKSYWEKAKEKFNDAKEKMSENKGNLMKLAGFAFIFFLAYEANKSLQETADAMSGCYQIQSCGGMAKPVKVGCQQEQCLCPLGSPPCASPGCGGSNCINYVWQKYTALQVLANIPSMVANPLLDDATSNIKTILTYGAIFVGVAALAYVAFKIIGRVTEKHKGEGSEGGEEGGGEEGGGRGREEWGGRGGEEGGGRGREEWGGRGGEEMGAPPPYSEKFRMCNLNYRYY